MLLTILLILTIFVGFVLMTKGTLKQEVAMPLVALVAVILAGTDGEKVIHTGFAEFARIAVLFTAVAVPAHLLQRSLLFDLVGMYMGELIGYVSSKMKIGISFVIPAFCLGMVYLLAALFHNTTSILVSSVIIFAICKSYSVKGLPVLAGALVASNLGGFSTRWGDTPNIIEAQTWGLVHGDFFKEIMPLNLVALCIQILFVSFWLKIVIKKNQTPTKSKFSTTFALIKFRNARRNISLDNRLILFGIFGLTLAIIGPLFFLEYELIFSALAILVSTLGDYSEHRSKGLLVLGIETYATLASIFVLAQVLTSSHIGVSEILKSVLAKSENNIFAITVISYVGTLLTEAASWASAASPIVYAHNPSHLGAWALGSGIFAGSSSLITAASAGIILTQETKDFPDGYKVSFGSYIGFGLVFSILMLLFYSLLLPLIFV